MPSAVDIAERFGLLAQAGKRLRAAIAAKELATVREEARFGKALLTQIEHEADRQMSLKPQRSAGVERARQIMKGGAADAQQLPTATPAVAGDDGRGTDHSFPVDPTAAGADDASAADYESPA